MKFSHQTEEFIEKILKNNVTLQKESSALSVKDNSKKSIMKLIEDLVSGDRFADQIFKDSKFKTDISKIQTAKQLPKPYGYTSHFFPEIIRKTIEISATYHIIYNFKIHGRSIFVHFITIDEESSLKMSKYDNYVKMIMIWLYMAGLHANKVCSKTLNIYLYMTDFKKILPQSSITAIDTINVNSGMSDVCRNSGEIIIYRKEEWFKVLIHETFHNYGLDFADVNITEIKERIKGIFPINSKMALYECYTELWAEIINCLFCAYVLLDKKGQANYKETLFLYFQFLIEFEKTFSLFQMIKFLNFMGLEYVDFIKNDDKSKHAIRQLYKEKTHVFPYFILKAILMNNYANFVLWCDQMNINILRFTKNDKTLQGFATLIEDNYNTKTLLDNISIVEMFIKSISKKNNYLMKTSRMSICELV